jgi:hypothetical protein
MPDTLRFSASISHRGWQHLTRPAIGQLGRCSCNSVMLVRGARRQAQAQAEEETTRLQVSPQSHRPVEACEGAGVVGK